MEEINTVKNYLEFLKLNPNYESPVFESEGPIVSGGLTLYRIEKVKKNGHSKPYLKVQPLRKRKSFLEGLKPVHILEWHHLKDPVFEN